MPQYKTVEDVIGATRADMRHAPGVAHHLDVAAETFDDDLARHVGYRSPQVRRRDHSHRPYASQLALAWNHRISRRLDTAHASARIKAFAFLSVV